MADYSKDVIAIREWLRKEPCLPQDFDDFVLRKFVHSCHGSLERSKQCLERFCSSRAAMGEVYCGRDPAGSGLQTAFRITTVATYPADDHELLIHQLDDPGLENLDFYNVLKAFAIQADYWIKHHDAFPVGHIIVIDIKDYTLRIIPKVNIMFFRDFLIYLLEAMPVRVKAVHIVNAPSYYDKLYSLVKPVLPAEIRKIVQFHASVSSLHNCVPPRHLPAELGGDAPSMRQQHRDWVVKIEDERKWYLDDSKWKADKKFKSKNNNNNSEQNFNGSFRTLSID